MNIDYNITPSDQSDLLKTHFSKCIVNHQRTIETDNLDATTFTDVERIVLNVIEILCNIDGKNDYWNDVSRCVEND